MSHPNRIEQNPKPDLAIERNFFLDISFPRSWPSMSIPATFMLVSEERSRGRSERVISEESEKSDRSDIIVRELGVWVFGR